MRDFRELKVWQAAHTLALGIYKVTEAFPRTEIYGLTAQLRRAGVSAAANIVEGSGRHSDPGMRQFLVIAHGSAAEVEYLLLIAHDLGQIVDSSYESLLAETQQLRRMLNGFIRELSGPRKKRSASS
jgi:four helix bundle protein